MIDGCKEGGGGWGMAKKWGNHYNSWHLFINGDECTEDLYSTVSERDRNKRDEVLMMPGGKIWNLGPGNSNTGDRGSDEVYSGIIMTRLRALPLPSRLTGHHAVFQRRTAPDGWRRPVRSNLHSDVIRQACDLSTEHVWCSNPHFQSDRMSPPHACMHPWCVVNMLIFNQE